MELYNPFPQSQAAGNGTAEFIIICLVFVAAFAIGYFTGRKKTGSIH